MLLYFFIQNADKRLAEEKNPPFVDTKKQTTQIKTFLVHYDVLERCVQILLGLPPFFS